MTEAIATQKGPYAIQVDAGKSYFWCACGRSRKQPFCDGSHSGTGFVPLTYEATAAKTVYFCGCRRSGKQPLCDGSHDRLQP